MESDKNWESTSNDIMNFNPAKFVFGKNLRLAQTILYERLASQNSPSHTEIERAFKALSGVSYRLYKRMTN